MKRISPLFFFSIVFLGVFLLPVAGVLSAKAPPLAGLMEMFDVFGSLETAFRGGDFAGAEKLAVEIEERYKKLVPEMKGTVDGKQIQKFGFIIGTFKKRLEGRDPEAMEKPFMMLQDMFFDVMDYYDYPKSPVLVIAHRYCGYAMESLEKKDYRNTSKEMDEIEELKERVSKALAGKNVSAQETAAVFEMVEQAQKLVKKKSDQDAMVKLKELQARLAP